MKSSPGSRWLRRSRFPWAGPSKEDMEDARVTAATGALGPVIAKLAALLGSDYKLRRHTRRDVRFLRSKLKPVHSILWNIWEEEELDDASMALKMEALDLADELDDTIFDFILTMERSLSNKRLVQIKVKTSPFQDFKKRASDVSGLCRSKWGEKKKPAVSASEKIASDNPSTGRPRAYPFVRKDATELVGMVQPRDKLIRFLVRPDETTPVDLHLKTVFIKGPAGMGKTTLADLLYEAIESKFQCRAFVSITRPGGNMREVLARILQQVAHNTSVPLDGTQASTEEHLIDTLSNFLKDKRYLVIIDDIWNSREWEVIMKSLPENNLGSRIVGTTRTIAVARNWSEGPNNNWLVHEMLPTHTIPNEWVYESGSQNVATGMVAMKADLVAEGFDNKHPIVRMCGGTPLAVLCMFSIVTQEKEKQAQQGLHAKACNVQDEILKHVMENGIQNTPGFEPLVESLQLGYDDLSHHMLKTCLLYCSIYPQDHVFEINELAKRWTSEGFVYTEEEAEGYIEELGNRGLILDMDDEPRMHPMVQHFLRWKSRQDNFITCSYEITSSYNNTSRIRRLCISNSPLRSGDEVHPLALLDDWNRIRSLVVLEGIERVPFEKLEGVRVLDLCSVTGLQDQHLKDICGLLRLRHLLGLDGDGPDGSGFSRIPGLIGNLQQLKTLDASGQAIKEVPGEIGVLQQLQTLRINSTSIEALPREIGNLHQLETLQICRSDIRELPKEIGKLQQLKTLDLSSNTGITVLPREIGELQQLRNLNLVFTNLRVLPKEIGKLQHLETLGIYATNVAKIPREVGELKELKSFILDESKAALPLEVCALVELPKCIDQALNKRGLVSELAGEMLCIQNGGLFVGATQMRIPPWIEEHFKDLGVLDIRICKLEEQGLKILREMPRLVMLTLRFEVVPKEPVVISGEGFEKLKFFTVDSRVPRVTFLEGAMTSLERLTFEFQFYAGPSNKDPVGIKHLRSLELIHFICNENWYEGGNSPCIRPTIDLVKREAQNNPRWLSIAVCGRFEGIYPLSPPAQREMDPC